MLSLSPSIRIFVHIEPTDMRKQTAPSVAPIRWAACLTIC